MAFDDDVLEGEYTVDSWMFENYENTAHSLNRKFLSGCQRRIPYSFVPPTGSPELSPRAPIILLISNIIERNAA
jgi:hypothetical protein